MGRRNAVGRAFRVSEKDIKSYDRVARPRMRANPMGVTTLAMVNGRGAYASARAGAKGQTRAQRLARARKLIGGKSMQSNARGKRAAFIKAMRKNKPTAAQKRSRRSPQHAAKTRGKRLAAYKAALGRGLSKESARRSALRRVPWTGQERSSGHVFAGKKAPTFSGGYRRNRDTVAEQKRYESGWEATFGKKDAKPKRKRSTKKAAAKGRKTTKRKGRNVAKSTRKTSRKGSRKGKRKSAKRKSPAQWRTVKTSAKRKRRVAYGKYKRAKLYNPRTGRTEYSYMYRTKSGKLRRIPTSAVAGWGERGKKSGERATKMAARVQAARRKAADRILKEGGVFVPNKKRRKRKSTGKWSLKKYNKARGAGYSKTDAKKIARGEKSMAKRRKRKSTKRKSAKRATSRKRRTTKRRSAARRRGTKRRGTKRRKSAARRTKRRGTKRRRKAARRPKRRAKRKSSKRRSRGKARRRTSSRKRKSSSRRRGGRRMKANRRRSRRRSHRRMRKNAFMANLKSVLISGTLVAVGYMGHRVLTSLLCDYVMTPYVTAPEGKEPNLTLKTWEKPICGAVVGLVGVGALSVMTDKRVVSGETAMKIGGGMVASLVQYVVVSALTQFEAPKAASYLSGYSNSTAYRLRNNRRRGIGSMRSIMPRYAPIGAFQQAAAGMGEYFTGTAGFQQAAAGVGEYFVPQGTKGVGQYEAAGPLAMQAAANGVGAIDDGIRPDSNLDHVLDLAESAAGLGEYITATPDNGGWAEGRVPTQSQWIPNGPLWAGELKVKDNMQTSELPAGVLATVGGNGILSG